MRDDDVSSLAEAIGRHQDGLAVGEALCEQQVANDRRIKRDYDLIRDAMGRDDLKGAALVDRATDRVYFLDDGLVACLPVVYSENVGVNPDLSHDADHDSLVALGETS